MIRKASCAGKSSNSEVSSYRSSVVRRKATSREPGGTAVAEARRPFRLRLDPGQCCLRREPAMLEVGTDICIAVAALREPPRPCFRCAIVIEVAKALELVECLPALLIGEAALLEPRIELRPRAVGGAEGAQRDVLSSRLSF